MVVSGAARTVQSCRAGVRSVLREASVARTSKKWSPGSTSYSTPESHASNAAPSREHSNVEPASAAKVKDARGLGEEAAGPDRIVVSGGVVSASPSMVQV